MATKVSSSLIGSISAAQIDTTVTTITGTYTLADTDKNSIIQFNSSSTATIIVPALFPIGTQIVIIQQGTAQATLSGAVGVTLTSNGDKFKTKGQYASIAVTKVTANTWAVGGSTSL